MAFKDTYTPIPFDGDLPEFVGQQEKAELIASGTVFPITGVRIKEATKYGDKYYVDITLDEEPRTLTFGKGGEKPVTTREDLLNNLIAYFKVDTTPVPVKLVKAGNAQLLELV